MKKIVLLSDGTGNSAAKQHKTNVWRLYQRSTFTETTKSPSTMTASAPRTSCLSNCSAAPSVGA